MTTTYESISREELLESRCWERGKRKIPKQWTTTALGSEGRPIVRMEKEEEAVKKWTLRRNYRKSSGNVVESSGGGGRKDGEEEAKEHARSSLVDSLITNSILARVFAPSRVTFQLNAKRS